jgi:ferredoxin
MIISKAKPMNEILACLEGLDSIFLIGCSQCATACQTGGEPEIAAMKENLENAGKIVVGSLIGHEDCHILDIKRELRQHKEEVAKANALLVMSCGAGAQSVTANSPEREVFTANDTVFLGNIRRTGMIFEEHCALCGDCVINETGGICPVTNCAKGLLNGPCGGVDNGKCEVDPEKDCAWVQIYKRLEGFGKLDKIKQIMEPKNYAASIKPAVRTIARKGGK